MMTLQKNTFGQTDQNQSEVFHPLWQSQDTQPNTPLVSWVVSTALCSDQTSSYAMDIGRTGNSREAPRCLPNEVDLLPKINMYMNT